MGEAFPKSEEHKGSPKSELTYVAEALSKRLKKLRNIKAGKVIRAGVMAGMLATPAVPALAEDHTDDSYKRGSAGVEVEGLQLSDEDQGFLNKAVRKIIERSEESIRKLKRWGATKLLKEKEAQLAAVRDNVNDPQYLSGLLFLRDNDIDVTSVGASLTPVMVKNKSFLKQRLDNIPEALRGTFKIGYQEFSLETSYDPELYTDPKFIQAAHELAIRGLQLTSRDIQNLVTYNKDTKPFYDGLQYLHNGGFMLLPRYLKSVSEEAFNDKVFLNALLQMHASGVDKVQDILSGKSGEGFTQEKAHNADYVAAVIRLSHVGVAVFSMRNYLSIEHVSNSDFMHNFESLIDLGVLDGNDLKHVSIDRLSDARIVEQVQKFQEINYRGLISNFMSGGEVPEERVYSEAFFRGLEFLAKNGVTIKNRQAKYLTDDRASNDRYLNFIIEMYNQKGSIDFKKVDERYANWEAGVNVQDLANSDLHQFAALRARGGSAILEAHIERIKEPVYFQFIQRMSREDSSGNRLNDLAGLDSRTKFELLVEGSQYGWPSTRNLIYDGYHHRGPEVEMSLYHTIQREYGDAHAFLMDIKPSSKELSAFLGILAQIGKMDSFFELIGDDEKRNDVVKTFLLGLENTDDARNKVAGLTEALRSLNWEGAKMTILSGIESEAQRLQKEIDKGSLLGDAHEKARDAQLWYELVAANYAKRHPNEDFPTWVQAALEKQREWLPTFEIIPEEKMFPNGVHIRYNTFFNNLPDGPSTVKDRDGHRSLQATATRHGGYVKFDANGELQAAGGGTDGWKIELRTEGKWKYVTLTKVDPESGRKIINIMNSPKMDNETMIAFYKHMTEHFVDPDTGAKGVQGFAMRGHDVMDISGTAIKIFETAVKDGSGDIPSVDFGSCGGHKYAQKIIEVSPRSFFTGTQSTGVADVNTMLQRIVGNYVLKHGVYDSKALKELADRKFAGYSERMQKYYAYYRWPHENYTAQIFAAFNTVKAAQ